MRKVLFGFSFFLLLLIFFIAPRNTLAQVCIGDSGDSGQCLPAQQCPLARIDGQGDCAGDPLTGPICCLDDAPPSGDADCGDSCTSDSDCTFGLSCNPSSGNWRLCSGSICPLCTGASGFIGVCLTPGTCAGIGKTDGGVSSCTQGAICCIDAPASGACSLTATPPFFSAFEFPVSLSSTTPNTTYRITTSSGCFGTCQGDLSTDSSGNISCRLACAPPETYTITAYSGSINCTLDVEVSLPTDIPCTGISGATGICVASLLCPSAYDPDGEYPQVCNIPGQRCCVPLASRGGNALCFDYASIDTAIGCIPVANTDAFIGFLLRWGIGIAGGIAFLLILYAGFQITTSGGDPKKLQAGKELLTSAIAGLLLLIFSVFILRFVGVDILGLPEFGR